MPHFLINSKAIKDNKILIDDMETVKHLAWALRAKSGENLKLIDENKVEYSVKILKVSKNFIETEIIDKKISKRELRYNIFIAQGILKQEGQNLFISNAAQLGAKGVYPFISKFSTVKENFAKTKISKWQKISFETFKQCERADIMPVFEILNLENIIKKFDKKNVIIFSEKEKNTSVFECTADVDLNKEILVVIGAEGGFSEDEFRYFESNNLKTATLGNLIFKAPNAVVAGVSNLILSLDLRSEK